MEVQFLIMKNMKISIITVCFNDSANLQITINSIKKNINHIDEFIVIDGKSTDDTLHIIKSNDTIISKWISEKDYGIYDAMNKGWDIAKRDNYILFIGAGDEVMNLPDSTDDLDADVILGTTLIDGKKTFKNKVSNILKITNTLHHQSILIKKSLIPKQPFNIKYKIYADFDLNQRIFKKKSTTYSHCKNFLCHASSGGVSAKFDIIEIASVVYHNFGLFYYIFSLIYNFTHKLKSQFNKIKKIQFN